MRLHGDDRFYLIVTVHRPKERKKNKKKVSSPPITHRSPENPADRRGAGLIPEFGHFSKVYTPISDINQ
jgi:hypothetical protein